MRWKSAKEEEAAAEAAEGVEVGVEEAEVRVKDPLRL